MSNKQNRAPNRLYGVADLVWRLSKWLWFSVIVVFTIGFGVSVASASTDRTNLYDWFHSFLIPQQDPTWESLRRAAIWVLITLICLSLVSYILKSSLKPPDIVKWDEILQSMTQDRTPGQLDMILEQLVAIHIILQQDQQGLSRELGKISDQTGDQLRQMLLSLLENQNRTVRALQEILSTARQKSDPSFGQLFFLHSDSSSL